MAIQKEQSDSIEVKSVIPVQLPKNQIIGNKEQPSNYKCLKKQYVKYVPFGGSFSYAESEYEQW